jgi:putative PIN family toxin of toxin-antitoxin system
MRIVIDTNVLISAALAGGKAREVGMFAADRKEVDWCATAEIMNEYLVVLAREKFGFPEGIRARWSDLIEETVRLISTDIQIEHRRDPKDAMFLACAKAADADYLITGDRDLADILQWGRTRVISVSQFLTSVVEPYPE